MARKNKKIICLMGWMRGNVTYTKIIYDNMSTEVIICIGMKGRHGRQAA